MFIIALSMLSAGTLLAEQAKPITADISKTVPGTSLAAIEQPKTITTDTSTTAKVCQLLGEYDKQLGQYTKSRTASRFNIYGTDLGASFVFDGKLWFFFGDTWRGVDQFSFTSTPSEPNDSMAYAEPQYIPIAPGIDTSSIDRCPKLVFVPGRTVNSFMPINISGGDVVQGAFGVPTGGFEYEGERGGKEMYIFYKTDAMIDSFPVAFGTTIQNKTAMMRSVLAKRTQDSSFEYMYDFSTYPDESAAYPDTKPAFITNSPFVVDSSEVPGLPVKGKGILIFGSGLFRLSNVYLAFISFSDLEKREIGAGRGRLNPRHVYYYAGKDLGGKPIWKDDWGKHNVNARPILDMGNQPDVGDISVVLDRATGFWYMTYYSSRAPGEKAIHFRFAPVAEPWNFSSTAQELIVPSIDPPVGYGQYIHVAGSDDGLSDPGRAADNGAGYGSYLIPSMFRTLSKKDGEIKREIYFTYSPWNPYTVELMKSVITIGSGSASIAPKHIVAPKLKASPDVMGK